MIQLREGVWRGPRPDWATFAILRRSGVSGLLNLESGFYESITAARGQEGACVAVCRRLDAHCRLDYLHLRMSPLMPPTIMELEIALGFIQIHAPIGGVYFHCMDGVDRTGVVAAAYRCVFQGWGVDVSILEMLRRGFHRYRYSYWLPIVRRRLSLLERR